MRSCLPVRTVRLHWLCSWKWVLNSPSSAQHWDLYCSLWSGSWAAKSLLQVGVQDIPSAPGTPQHCPSPEPELLLLSPPAWFHTREAANLPQGSTKGCKITTGICQSSNVAGKLWHWHWETIRGPWRRCFQMKYSPAKMTWCLWLGPGFGEPLPASGREMIFSPRPAVKVTWVSRDWIQTFSQQDLFHTTQINSSLAAWSWCWLKYRPMCSTLPWRGWGTANHLISSVLGRQGLPGCSAQQIAVPLVSLSHGECADPPWPGLPHPYPSSCCLAGGMGSFSQWRKLWARIYQVNLVSSK